MGKSKKKKSSINWVKKKNKEFFFQKARNLKYRSRSAFKLIEIDKKFKIFKKNSYLLDLGSSPGGWSQVASENIKYGKILAVDIKDMKLVSSVSFILGSFLDQYIKKKIEDYFNKKIDLVISDMASNTTGNKNADSYNTCNLCLSALMFSSTILQKKGIFVGKFFMGSEYEEIKKVAKKMFKIVINFKPNSSKKESKEMYIICKNLI